jgi:hypothetical protein
VGLANIVATAREWRATHGDGDRRRLADVFRAAAPSLELAAQLFAQRSLDTKRKPQRQDFWDFEHASLAPVYADAFVTRDRGLAALLKSARKPPAARAALLTSLSGLTQWLSTGSPSV